MSEILPSDHRLVGGVWQTLQLGSSPGSAGILLEQCWREAVAAEGGAAESHGLAVERKDLVEPYW